jgi:hypothetical protein
LKAHEQYALFVDFSQTCRDFVGHPATCEQNLLDARVLQPCSRMVWERLNSGDSLWSDLPKHREGNETKWFAVTTLGS